MFFTIYPDSSLIQWLYSTSRGPERELPEVPRLDSRGNTSVSLVAIAISHDIDFYHPVRLKYIHCRFVVASCNLPFLGAALYFASLRARTRMAAS